MASSRVTVGRTGSAATAAGASPRATAAVALLLAASVAVPLAGVAAAPGRLPLVALGVLAGGAMLAALVAFGRAHLTAHLLFLASVGLAYVPIDKYFSYVQHIGGWPGLRVGIADLALVPLAAVALLGWWLGRVRNALPRGVLVVYALLLLQYLLSTLHAARRDLAVFELAGAAHAIVVAIVTAALYRRRALVPILVVTVVAVLVHAAAGAAEYALGRPVWTGTGQTAALQEVLRTGEVRIRPAGLLVHPIILADFFLMTLPALAGAWLVATRAWQRLALAVAILAGTAALGLTLARGAWASTALAGGVLLVLAWREGLLDRATRRRLRPLALALALGAVAFSPIAYERFTQSDPGNVRVRVDLNEIALSMISAHPVAGVGLNNFVTVMGRYDRENVERYFPAPAHNLYMLEGAEAGVPALLLWAALVAALVGGGVRGLRRVRASPDRLTRWVAAGIVASLCGLAFSQLADFSWRLEPLRTIVWMEVGLLFGMLRQTEGALPRALTTHPEGRA